MSQNNLENPYYKDCYFSKENGFEESKYIFIEGNQIDEKLQKNKNLTIGETGFGTGLNLLSLIHSLKEKSQQKITFYSVEKYPLSPERIKELLDPFKVCLKYEIELFLEKWNSIYPNLQAGENKFLLEGAFGEIEVQLYWGEALYWLQNSSFKVDSWFLDGHSPDKNREMWSLELFSEIFNHSYKGSSLATFTASGFVKQNLRSAGFTIKRAKGFGKKRHMLKGYRPL